MGRLTLLLVLVACALPAAATAEDRASATGSARQISQMAELQSQLLVAINQLRREKGLSELRLNAALSLAAYGHSVSMAQHGYFRHEGWNGSSFWKRIKPKYRPLRGHHWGVGENMVWASPELTADQTIQMWMNSPSHRKNLLTPAWREVGLGAVRALAAPGVYEGLAVTILTADFGVR